MAARAAGKAVAATVVERVAAMGAAATVVDWEEVVRVGVTVAGVREVAKAAVVREVGAMVVEARAPVALALSYPRR